MSLLNKTWKEVNGFCSLCEVKIKSSGNWKQHLKRKKHMKKENNLKNNIIEEEKKYECKNCDKKYKYLSGLYRHKKKCKGTKKTKTENTSTDNPVTINNNDNSTTINDNSTNTVNNITNNNHNTNNINIILRPYGEENYKNAIPFDKIEDMVLKIYRLNDASFLYENLYEKPPNNNVAITDLSRDKYCDVFTDDKTIKKRFTETVVQYKIDNFAQNVEDLTKDYFNSKPRTYNYNILRNAFEKRARYELGNPKKLKENITLSLYNNRINLDKLK